MSEPINLSERRAQLQWETEGNTPDAHTPELMLEAALARLRSGDLKADHIILCHGTLSDDGHTADFNYMQAGTLNPYGQIGLLAMITKLMLD